MFIYLSKKIAIPNNTKINAIAWNKLDGYIAVGGENGLLKVLKLDSSNDNDGSVKNKGLAATSNLSMNQTLEGHTENIEVIVWNESHKKLTTSDENGVIIVWMLYKNVWYEEMINNRKKSTVVGMSWSADGQKICIIYEDGVVIVGCVGGNRIWGKELKPIQLSGVQWSPDSKLLLFSLKTGMLHLYDNQGNFVMKLNVLCHDPSFEAIPIVGLDWYNGINGNMYSLCPNLAITFENGKTQLMKNESDISPIIVDTKMFAVHCSWNHNGSLLAICGRQFAEEKQVNLVQFYSPFGEHLRTLKVPGNSIARCVWEGGSLRVALAVDSFVYFANIRPDYKWCYFKKTVVFSSFRPHKPGICLSFWDTSNNQCHTRWVHTLLGIAGYGDHCVVATKSDNEDPLGKYGLILYNTLGTPVDGKYINIEPIAIGMSSYQVFASSRNNFIVWYYKTPKSMSANSNRIKMFHIDDSPSGAVEIIQELEGGSSIPVSTHETIDPVCCLVASDKCLIIGRDSGLIQFYVLPHLVLTNRFKISTRPHKMAINCSSTRLSIIDISGLMTVLDISEGVSRPATSSTDTKLERKDVWAMCWASDNPQLLAIMEKTRMYIFRGMYPEEPVACSGYICSFSDLEIQAVLLDEVIEQPEKPHKDHIVKIEVKSLRDTRQLLEKVGINEACQFVEENRHPRLWRLIAEAALKEMNLTMAESCFVRSKDYSKVLFVKKLQEVNNYAIRRARIATYFKNFDEAEKIYMEADRSDLALKLRQTLGDWFRVIQILKNGITAPDTLLQTAYNATADYFAHFNNWASAIEYYELAKNTSKVVECYYHLEDWQNLDAMIDCLPEGDPLLERIGDMFASNAVHNEAVKAYVKVGKVKSAINLCIMHNRWDVAIDLAKTYKIPKISDLLVKYTSHLVEQGQIMNAVQVNVQAKYYLLAAEYVFKLAKKESQIYSNKLLRIKKYYVYAARLVEINKNLDSGDWQPTDELMVENAWKGAEAYHYYMMCHRYLYYEKPHEALCTAYKLQDYQDYICPVDVYSLLAFAAYLDRKFGVCSAALINLKSLKNISEVEKSRYEKLALDIFARNKPINPDTNMICCDYCAHSIHDWYTQCPNCNIHFPTCIATGRSILSRKIWFCKFCKHSAIESQMMNETVCPLCHSKN
ncbi:WD repeat-containing protein 35 [Diorhabda sublineata]|uniref:WD repeat-containing protein 35 n=1 Tax=Diorhabda sublineata TaxID=1163346 RepID=UPI0024E0CCA6|nr:WD repeat-containing protein 35 [Diorhabda sublineata]